MAEEAGADLIGVVGFTKSSRCVDPLKIREIFDAVPSLTRCCVAHEPTAEQLVEICAIEPDVIQVSCEASIPDSCTARIFRSVRPGDPLPPDADAIVVDASRGSGLHYDAAYAVSVVMSAQVPVFLAGGLTPENVTEAVRAVQPFGVDVATGVECAPGKKDREKVRTFIQRAKGERL